MTDTITRSLIDIMNKIRRCKNLKIFTGNDIKSEDVYWKATVKLEVLHLLDFICNVYQASGYIIFIYFFIVILSLVVTWFLKIGFTVF